MTTEGAAVRPCTRCVRMGIICSLDPEESVRILSRDRREIIRDGRFVDFRKRRRLNQAVPSPYVANVARNSKSAPS